MSTRIDFDTGNLVGAGEDAAFEMIKEMTGLPQLHIRYYPKVGLYRQLPVALIFDESQLKDLASSHRKSSVDIMIVAYEDAYEPRLCKIAVRVEGKKGSYKMKFQGVQADYLTKHCQIVDVHKLECKELFKNKVNEQSKKELLDSFKTAKVEFPGRTS